MRQKLSDEGNAIGPFEVNRDATLASVVLDKIRAAHLGPPAERVAALRRFDLDDVGTERRQQGAGIRSRNVAARLEDADSRQRPFVLHVRPPPEGLPLFPAFRLVRDSRAGVTPAPLRRLRDATPSPKSAR